VELGARKQTSNKPAARAAEKNQGGPQDQGRHRRRAEQ
jgi:hypothetical protein